MTTFTMSINRTDGNKFEADKVEFKDLNFATIESSLSGVMEKYSSMRTCINEIEALDIKTFKGEAAEAIKVLIDILPKYLDDYEHTVKDFITIIKSANGLVNDIPSAKIIKEIDGI